MCGLVALAEPGRRFDAALLADMGEDIRHRGPDSDGVLAEPGVALVFRRLAILDTTAASDQPMTDPSGRYTLVFNGEIYNYRALRAALSAEGVALRTSGDTEVLLLGYIRWGEAVLDRLEGMYAFVIVDRVRNRLVAARDPFGIKPLYLLRRGRLVGFASEMRPLLRLVPAEPDPMALAELLTFGWAAGRLSNLRGIERVPGGTVLTVALADGTVTERRFCNPLDTLKPDQSITPADAERLAAEAVHEAVRAHLVSDVGYTVQLSGGVDSSLITAIASAETRGRLTSFGINLGNFVDDESAYRRQVIERYRLDHHEVLLTGRDFADALPRAVHHLEGPSPHLGCVLLMLLCDRIRTVSKVVLTGEGGDEMFAGYLRYAHWHKLGWQERLGRLLPRGALPATWPFHGIRRLACGDAAVFASVYTDPAPVQDLFPALMPAIGARDAASRRFRRFPERLFAVDQTAYLESLLIRQDKMAMAASVEARTPFVHLPLVRLLNRLPHAIRAPGGVTKPLLKKIAEPYLPHNLLYRRKIGLHLPVAEWLQDGQGVGRYLDDLREPDARLAAFADSLRLRTFIDLFRRGERPDLAPAIMRLVNLETWLRSLPPAPA